jgi:hypothetical protein
MATGAIEGEKAIRYARLELSPPNYERLRAAAAFEDRSIASFIRRAVLERIAALEAGLGRPGPEKETPNSRGIS